MKKNFVIYIIISVFTVLAAVPAFSQDEAPAAAPQAAAPQGAAPQAKETAIYGEVQTVNAAVNTLSVQYYDYDSDSEKTAEVAVTADTKMENAKTVSDIKKGDWVDVTYVISGGKNMAKSVSVEKEEPAAEPMAAATPADISSGE